MANLSNINGKFVVEQTTGYVGVGTTDPNFLIEAAGANSEIALNSTSASIYRLRSTSSDSFIITKNGVGDRLVIDSSGNSTFGGNVTVGNSGNINIPTAASGNANLHFDGTDFKITSNSSSANLKLETSSTTRLTINSTGDAIFAANVGINTGGATPDRVLDVRGNGLSIFGSGSNTELMLRGQVEGTGTIRSLGAWHWSVRSDVGGDNDDLKLLRFNTGTFAGTAMQIRSDNGGVAIGLNNEGYASQILSVKSGAADNVFYGESSDANCFASFRDSNSTANIEFGAIGNSHVFRKDTSIKMVIDGDGDVGIGTDLPNAKLDIGIGTLANNGYGGLRIFDDANHFWMLILKNSVGASRLSLYNGQGSIPLVFQEGGGNVGIGTTSPLSPLTVHGQQRWYTTNSDGNELRGFFNPGGAGDPAELSLYQANGTSVGVELRATGNSYFSGGNVGIGVTGPSSKLTVYGGGSTTSTLELRGGANGADNATISTQQSMAFQVGSAGATGRSYTFLSGGLGYGSGTALFSIDSNGGTFNRLWPQTTTSGSSSVVQTTLIPEPGIYEYYLQGNPNAGGSSAYTSLQAGLITIAVDYTPAKSVFLRITKHVTAQDGGGSSNIQLNLNVYMLYNGSASGEQSIANKDQSVIYLTVSGYVGTVGSGQILRLTRKV